MRRLASHSLVLVFLAAISLLTSCGRHETEVAVANREKMLLVGNLAEPRDLDPHILTSATDSNIASALFEGLVVLDEKTMRPLPGIADHWEMSPDGLVYTFHLRPNARWSDGHPMTSDDFIYSFHRILSPALASEYSYMLWAIKNAEAFNSGKLTDFSAVGLAAPDAATLRITLERPTPFLLSLAGHLTWLPVDRRTIEKYGRMDQRDTGWTKPGRLVGNGPYILSEWRENSRIVVRKNPQYWDAAHNALEGVTFFPIENSDAEERNFRAGQLHATHDLPTSKLAGYRERHPDELHIDPTLGIVYLNFNVHRAPFDQPKVRRAFSLAIDRVAISSKALQGATLPAESLTPPNCGGYTARAHVPTDFAAARQLLAEAGFPGGRGIPSVPLQVLNDSRQTRAAEALQAIWLRELGVHITIEPSEQKMWLENQKSMLHTLGFLGWFADYPDPYTFLNLLVTGNGNNWSGWSNPVYDSLIAKAQQTLDPQARFELFQQAEALALEQSPVAPILINTQTYLVSPAVKNWQPAPLLTRRYQVLQLANP